VIAETVTMQQYARGSRYMAIRHRSEVVALAHHPTDKAAWRVSTTGPLREVVRLDGVLLPTRPAAIAFVRGLVTAVEAMSTTRPDDRGSMDPAALEDSDAR
jgi:hypothetical protein